MPQCGKFPEVWIDKKLLLRSLEDTEKSFSSQGYFITTHCDGMEFDSGPSDAVCRRKSSTNSSPIYTIFPDPFVKIFKIPRWGSY
jgi:hypothetical protein